MQMHSLQGPSSQTALPRHRGSDGRGLRALRFRARAAAVERAAPSGAQKAVADLPSALRNATAVLRAPDATVYVLGVSHVSQVACEQVQELVAAVKPEVVVVEVCKDRTSLLVDPESMQKAPDTWTCSRVAFDGLPSNKKAADKEKDKKDEDKAKDAAFDDLAAEVWPTAADLAPLLRTRIGRVVTTAEVEGDVATLENTGLFSRVRPYCEGGRRGDAPLLGAIKSEGGEGLELEYVSPLGCTRFVVEPRQLPAVKSMAVRLDSSLKAAGVTQEQLDEVAAEAVAACAADPPRPGLLAYLAARKRLIDLVHSSRGQQEVAAAASEACDVVVEFSGVDSGNAEAVVRARRPGDGDAPFVSGLESSAEGDGVERFRPAKRGVQLSPRMSLPAEAAARMNAIKAAKRAEAAMTARGGAAAGGRPFPFRLWRPEEVAPADLTSPDPDPARDTLAMVLTGLYSGLQAKAGRAVGVEPGAAWRAAMRAATEHGATQVILGDRPAFVSQRRMADAMFPSVAARLAGALALLVGAGVAAASPALGDLLAGALPGADAGAGAAAWLAGAAGAAAVMWPVVGPLAEVWRFSRLDGPAVEEVVAVKEPIQANLDKPLLFWGEDALLRWPGVWGPLIAERDAYMARVAAAAATGKPTGAPAYVADEAGGQLVWRYAMAAGGPEGSAPRGLGDGEYGPAAGVKNVVVVVGTAHVRGMCAAWEEALARPGDVGELAPAAERKPEDAAAAGSGAS